MRRIAIEEGTLTPAVIAGLEDLGFSMWYLPRSGPSETRRLLQDFPPDIAILPLAPRVADVGESLPELLPSVRLVVATGEAAGLQVEPSWADLAIPRDADPIYWLLSLLALQPRDEASEPSAWRQTLLAAIERTHHAFKTLDVKGGPDPMLDELRSRLETSFRVLLRMLIERLEGEVQGMAGHSGRVSDLAGRMASVLRLDPAQVEAVRMAGLLHDLGMHLVLPTRSLRRTGPLHQGEWEIVRSHPIASAAVLAPLTEGGASATAIREHHERMDGSGYPLNKRGDEVSVEARIVSVADAFQAMTHPRPHRQAVSPERATEDLRREGRDGRFDLQVCDALVTVVGSPG